MPRSDATLNVCMLGDFRMTLEGKSLPAFSSRHAELLFSYLLLNRDRLFPRDVLIEKFFNVQKSDAARKRLRNEIWRIRSVLEPKGVPNGMYLTVTNREVGFNSDSHYWLDSQEFESAISKTSAITNMPLCHGDYALLISAMTLYRGDLLDGIYDEWCIWEKERLKLLYLRGLDTLMNHHSSKKEWDQAVMIGKQLISHDPLREHIHRDLMRFYYFLGDRPAALVQYNICSKLLQDELDLEPMCSTKELYQSIKSESIPDPVRGLRTVNSISYNNGVGSVTECLSDIHVLADQLDNLSTMLKRRIQLVEEFDHQQKL